MSESQTVHNRRAIGCAGAAAAMYVAGIFLPRVVTLFSGPGFYLMDILAILGIVFAIIDIFQRKNVGLAWFAILVSVVILAFPVVIAFLLVSH